MAKSKDQFSKKEAARRFEDALKGARLVKRAAPDHKPSKKKRI